MVLFIDEYSLCVLLKSVVCFEFVCSVVVLKFELILKMVAEL